MHNSELATLFLGREQFIMSSCQSSNLVAARMIQANKPSPREGALIWCREQTQGRGQRGNTWATQGQNNLTFSIILYPEFLQPAKQFYLNIITSLAIYQAIAPYLGSQLAIKWPNDLIFPPYKLCGILIENNIRGHILASSILGIGLNVNQNEFPDPRAASLYALSGQTFSQEPLLHSILLNLEQNYLQLKAGKLSELKEEYLQHLYGYQRMVKLKDPEAFEGYIECLEDDGRILVSSSRGPQFYGFKEIRFDYGPV